jgi:hypothetical protein
MERNKPASVAANTSVLAEFALNLSTRTREMRGRRDPLAVMTLRPTSAHVCPPFSDFRTPHP